ncbi:MAG TPA: alpha/beta fold hydrolase [Hyphomicrobiaceae bacterium]|jgi:pimeloyl-ACP methyl ester carboxylesterase
MTPLVLVHGIGADGRMFAPVVERLADTARAIVWDLPGYRGKRLDGALTFPGLAAALAADLDALGIERVVVLGHSIGGMVAQELAATRPRRLRALILSATTSVFGSRDGTFQREFVKARLAPLDAGQSMAEMAAEVAPRLVGSRAEAEPAAVRLMSEVPEPTFRAAVACLVTFNRRAEAGRIGVPTLLIAGEEDTNAPLKTMSRMAEAIPGARLEVLRGIGHLAPLECPDRYADIVRRFLAGLPTEGEA